MSVARVAKLLNELVEVVETARVVPMSASCVVPREHVLDLLDALREALPSELDAAHRVVAHRDALLVESRGVVRSTRTEADEATPGRSVIDAGTQADAILADARHQAAQLVRAAEGRGLPHGRIGPGRARGPRVRDNRAPECAGAAARSGPRRTTMRLPRGPRLTGTRSPSGRTPRVMPTGRCSISWPCCGGR